jgi:hypothetical protein
MRRWEKAQHNIVLSEWEIKPAQEAVGLLDSIEYLQVV